jgi:hypothetical protein
MVNLSKTFKSHNSAFKKILISFALGLGLTLTTPLAFALERLPVPSNLVTLSSSEGESLFESSSHQSFWQLMPFFTTQLNLTYCGPASASMVLNALNIPAPTSPIYAPFKLFDQNDFFTPDVLKIVTPTQVNMRGASIEELSDAIRTFGVDVTMAYGTESTEEEFRQAANAAVSSSNQFVIVNFYRKHIQEDGGGHFSPLAAYDEKTDRFLLLDVARYKYPAVWVKTADLYKAISLNKEGKPEKIRGYMIIGMATHNKQTD